jgi:hypothetical protein
MTQSITRNKSTDAEEHRAPSNISYKVWVDIEEYDELTACGYACDAPGGELATFDTYDEAWDFAVHIDRAYSTRRGPCDSGKKNADLAKTLSHQVAHSIDAIVSYLWASECADFETCPGVNKDNHIFLQLQTVKRWLELNKTQAP